MIQHLDLRGETLLVGPVREAIVQIVEVAEEIVVSVAHRLILWRLVLPPMADSLAPLVKLDELLELEVGAAESISEPADAEAFEG